MKEKIFSNKAFTLIEVLVVVLIIGILAAIAIPQYQKSVAKSRAVEAFTTLSALKQAVDEYSLQHNGEFPLNYNDLSVIPPGEITKYAIDNDTLETKYYKYILTGCRVDVTPTYTALAPAFIYNTCDWGHNAFPETGIYCYVYYPGAGDKAQLLEELCQTLSSSEPTYYSGGNGVSYKL